MSKISLELIALYKELERTAKKHNMPIATVMKQLQKIHEDKLSIALANDYEETKNAVEVYKKHGIGPKVFARLIKNVEDVKLRPRRKLKEFIYIVAKDYDITHEEYRLIAKYLDKRKLDADAVIKRLKEIRGIAK